MTARVEQIHRFPVKGLNAESLDSVTLAPAAGLPEDRRFALAYGLTTGAKRGFFQLTREEKLAQLKVTYDAAAPLLTIHRQGRQVVSANPCDQTGRMLLNQFFAGFFAGSPRGTPSFQEVRGPAASDESSAEALPEAVSIINLASVRDFERVARTTVDPRRFRGNLLIDGLPAWDEFSWLGRELVVGNARLKVTERTERCAATNVNPETAERDMNIPLTLRKGFGHMDLGVYAEVTLGGNVRLGDGVALAGAAAADLPFA
ncbi:MOSC domain-containing protein [Pelagibius sp.]|uniref:MOSC domain-containing protein n=1 Tax=Pelagibius sp. TaxID=1931238 RepID=UPI002605F463|nr:MOSC domain-containing protein [Pelagibius sp.]